MKKAILLIFVLLLYLSPNAYSAQWGGGANDNPLKGTTLINDIDTQFEDEVYDPLSLLLKNFNQNISIQYLSASQLTATAGEITVTDSTGDIKLFLTNASNTTIGWSDLDAGAEASSTTYYVYATAASSSSTTPTFKISTSSSAPSGSTYYKKIGSFLNNSSSDIDRTSIATNAYGYTTNNSSGTPMITAAYDYATSASSFTAKTGGLKIAYGQVSISADTTQAITNLPFTSSSSYSMIATIQDTSTSQGVSIYTSNTSGSASSITNPDGSTHTVYWIAIGT